MRVVTWNCRSGTDAKVMPVIEELRPDLLIMPESSRSPAAATDTLLAKGIPHACDTRC
jgi:ABC-type Fe3+-hydroxamate transport system substrate-binding protein